MGIVYVKGFILLRDSPLKTSEYVFYYIDVYSWNKYKLELYWFFTTLWNVELFSVTDALITLNIPSTNQIAGKWKFRQGVREIILTGNSQKLFSWKYFV